MNVQRGRVLAAALGCVLLLSLDLLPAGAEPPARKSIRVEQHDLFYFGTGPQGSKRHIRAHIRFFGKGPAHELVGSLAFLSPEGLQQLGDRVDDQGRPHGVLPLAELTNVLAALRGAREVSVSWDEAKKQFVLETR